MTASFDVIERIEDEGEGREPVDIESGIFDVGMVSCEFDFGVESLCHFFGDQSFWFLDMFLTEEELAIEVAKVDCVEIDYVYLAKAGQDEVFEDFTADSAGADKEDFRL